MSEVCATADLVSHYFGPSEVHATADLGDHYFHSIFFLHIPASELHIPTLIFFLFSFFDTVTKTPEEVVVVFQNFAWAQKKSSGTPPTPRTMTYLGGQGG